MAVLLPQQSIGEYSIIGGSYFKIAVIERGSNMTEQQRGVYMLLCITGQFKEAEEYRLKCNSESDSTDEPSPEEE